MGRKQNRGYDKDFTVVLMILLVFSNAYLVDASMNKLPGTVWEAVYYNKKKFNSWH